MASTSAALLPLPRIRTSTMKILAPFILLLLSGCAISPVIIPDSTQDSAMLLKIKNDIEQGNKIDSGWGWILWYLPVLFLVCAWGYKEFFGKKHDCPEKEEKPVQETPKVAEEQPLEAVGNGSPASERTTHQ